MKKKIVLIYLLCLAFRLVDEFMIRTDQGIIGELFVHKLIGIAIIAFALYKLEMHFRNIGFRKDRLFSGLLKGLLTGGAAYAVAYGVDILVSMADGGANLGFYITSYNIAGNTVVQAGALFVAICVAGNIINVIMEEGLFRGLFITIGEKKCSFWNACLFSAFLFGLWHIFMPIRNILDGEQTPAGAIISALVLFIASSIFAIQLGMEFKMTGALWEGMVVHFINNASANLLHVVTPNGADGNQTLRIAIAQVCMLLIVTLRYLRWQKEQGKFTG
jgi:membrane protease YdiL (CAAX protease family)